MSEVSEKSRCLAAYDTPMDSAGSTIPPRSSRSVLLQGLYDRYHHRRFVTRDPLITLYGYPEAADREIAGLIAAVLAYGNVTAILGGIAGVMARLDGQPHAALIG
jgi:hypothetical protein